MTSIQSNALNQQLYQRLFDHLDVDKSAALSLDEIKATGAKGDDAIFAEAFKALDGDHDGKIIRAEMTGPALSFASETIGAMIATQTSSAPDDGKVAEGALDSPASGQPSEAVKALFARADVDGDGFLSSDEMKAEGALRRAANLDAGFISGPIFIPRDANRDGLIAPEEISSGSSQPLKLKAAFFDEMPPEHQQHWLEVREKHNALNPANPMPEPIVYSAEEKQRIRQQQDTDWAERMSGPEGTYKLLDREVTASRDNARAEFDSMTMTDTLSARLMKQILAGLETKPASASVIA